MKTLDDFAVGINYNKEPYTSNNRFSVVVPDLESQHKFFTVDNYTHKYITNGRCDAKDQQEIPQPILPISHKEELATPVKVEKPIIDKEIVKQEVVRTPIRRAKSTEKTSAMKATKQKGFIKLPKKASIYSPGELYAAKNNKMNSSFVKANPYKGSRYYDMTSIFGLNKDNTLGDVLKKSQEAETSTQQILKMQQNKEFLTTHGLPPVPKERIGLKITHTSVCKNPSKKIGNETHIRMTNGGYSRTTYGGYFMQ